MWRWRFWTACSRRSSAADARRGRLAVLVGACLLAAAVPHAPAADKLSGVLSVKDSLTSPGKPVRLEARLVRAGLLAQGGLGGELVEFLVDGRSAGTAMTGGDGRAFLDYTPRMRGNQRIAVRLATTKRVESPEARGTLFAWERRRPILLVELAVLAEERRPPPPPIPPVPFDIGPGTLPSPAPDAAHELKRLTDYFYNVIYLSWQPERGLREGEDVREWLDRHGFPPGLALTLSGGAPALTQPAPAQPWAVLLLAFFGSKFVLEIVLGRTG